MKKMILLIALVFGLIGIAFANIATYTTNGKDIVVYDSTTNHSFMTNMDEIDHQLSVNKSMYWIQLNSAAQAALDSYEDRMNNKQSGGKP